ncbi:MAG: hypothetical protein V1882_01350 [Candidatus Omnitrophota bacterium]
MGKKSRLKAERASAALLSPEQPPPPVWAGRVIVFLGVGFILTSLIQVGAFADFGYYRQLFQDNSEGYIRFRYFMSWMSRFLGLTFGVGFLFRKEFFRRALIVLASGTIAVAYWKHPHAAFIHVLHRVSEQMTAKGVPLTPEILVNYLQAWNLPWATVSWLAQVTVIVVISSEVFVALVVLFFLTRPAVKSLCR